MDGIKNIVKALALSVVLLANVSFTVGQVLPRLLANQQKVKVKIAFGHTASPKTARLVQLLPASPGLTTSQLSGSRVERNDRVGTESIVNCGAGDVDELIAEISWPKPTAAPLKVAQHNDEYSINGDGMWGYLMEKGSPGQVARLQQDQWKQPDAPVLTVQLNREGTEGFSEGLEQLLQQGAMWFPEWDIYITTADKPIDFKTHLASLKGERTLDVVKKAP